MNVYYNENESFVAQWLRNLIVAGHLPAGDVDERPIQEVQPDDLKSYLQCHFFAGIGGWAHALELAGWGDRPVWTGSCPCQPFSIAGKQEGHSDPRHLWPEWFRLIRACRPAVVLGEQVEAAIRLGWLDLVFGDLEGEGYTCGATVLGAHSVGAPHIRQRLYFVADSPSTRLEGTTRKSVQRRIAGSPNDSPLDGHACLWSSAKLISCRDGKFRPVEPSTFPLAHGVSNRVGRLRAYGNAIVPQVAAEFIKAFLAVAP